MRDQPTKETIMRRKASSNALRDAEQEIVEEFAKKIEDKATELYQRTDRRRGKDFMGYANTQLRLAVRKALNR